ncbi:MAG: type VI secretion system tip protein TssI/VgrG [Thermodesulfobacteriota bacterium]
MTYLDKQRYGFVSKAPGLSEESFGVVSFKGFEAISQPYEFDITLVSDDRGITPHSILPYPAKFVIARPAGGDVEFNGILAQFEEIREYGGYIFYRALLVPKLWWLNLTHHNQVFLDCQVDEIIQNSLKDGGLHPDLDFRIRLQKTPPKFEYICQYDETHFNFVSRWAEREGIYYFFEQTPEGEKVIFTDTSLAHTDLAQGPDLHYSTVSGLDHERMDEVIQTFTCRRRMLPKRIFLKDYNYEKPSLGIEGRAQVDEKGRGENYFYGEHFFTPEEGDRLAKTMAEAFLCRQSTFFGESSVPFLRPGYRFKLSDHYRDEYNRKYLITEVTHEGHQTGYLISGIRDALAQREEKMAYRNHFTALYSDLQFRPERKATKPKISGTLHARVDASGTGQYAELDDLGRYKVHLPFDINSDHGDGRASAYIRMMQPYAGAAEGMHFPLRKGTEVLLTFIGGDPDRPVIAGAVPNPETTSPVTSTNQTQSVIQTSSNNQIKMEDLLGSQRILMQTPTAGSWVRMGAPNDPPISAKDTEQDQKLAQLKTKDTQQDQKITRLENQMKTTLRDEDPTAGIRIFTTGTLVEESRDNQSVILDDPDYATRTFSMTEEAYNKIKDELKAEQTRLQEEYNIITDPGKKTEKQQSMLSDTQIDGIIANLKGLTNTTRSGFVTSVTGTYTEEYVKNIILRNIEDANAKKREIKVDGDQINVSADGLKMTAVGDSLKISMTEGGIVLDAGSADVTINCGHFYLNNQKEDNITYGHDYAEHHGTATEKFYGTADEEFHGTKNEAHYGNLHSAHFGGAAEAFAGGKVEWSAVEALEFYTGFKQEFTLVAALEVALAAKLEVFLGEQAAINLLFKQELFLGFTISAFIGSCVELRAGPKLVAATSAEVELGSLTVKQRTANILLSGIPQIFA